MFFIFFLILFPLISATTLLFFKSYLLRKIITVFSTFLIGLATLLLFIKNFHSSIVFFSVHSSITHTAILVAEILITLYLFYLSFKFKKYLTFLLVFISSSCLFLFEFFYSHQIVVQNALFVDKFSIIMALIVGVIGSLICIYSLSYMEHFHHQYSDIKNRIPFFFGILFLFLSAMFGLIFSNNLLWLYFFWEITTLCSFLLIGYKQDSESIRNAFHALNMNLLGGIAFIAGIYLLFINTGMIELNQMLTFTPILVIIPAVLFSFAGLTKSAQLPFSSWLLGAMVAPTPVSALLHSSTMVKAGVYLILKMSPLLTGTIFGFIIAFIGGLTFLLTSFIAVSQSDGKKILAYSTIANLGLIVACAGVGTYEAVWAGIMLIIFHAIAKCLMFLCVGTVEAQFSSRNVEDMDGLIVRLPQVANMMLVGMAGMFIAPFGMLISKWAVLEAFIRENPLLALLIIFGSAPTLFFWVKWMGKILAVPVQYPLTLTPIKKSQYFSLWILSFLTVAICAGFPLVSYILVQPYVLALYGMTVEIGKGNILIMLMMLGVVLLFPFALSQRKNLHSDQHTSPYLGGANIEKYSFQGSAGKVYPVSLKNYYLNQFCNERIVMNIGVYLTLSLLIILITLGVPLLC